MIVNGDDVLTIIYDMNTVSEVVSDSVGSPMMNITYDPVGRPLKWVPTKPFAPMEVSYNRFVLRLFVLYV